MPVKKNQDVKISKKNVKGTSIKRLTIQGGEKTLVISLNEFADYVLIHTGTSFTDVSFSRGLNPIVETLNENGTVYQINLVPK